jgi:membrane AbrB-like protein
MPPLLARQAPVVQWLLLAALSIAFIAGLLVVHLPAALLLGSMLAAIVFGTSGANVRVPKVAYVGAQAIVGCLIATMITPAIISTFVQRWPWFVASALSTLIASSLLGLLLSRARGLPGTTAIWGVTPGAAMAMVLMADAFGADARMVAFMQYLRVVFVALVAASVAHFWLHLSNANLPAPIRFAPIDPIAFGETLAIALLGAMLGTRLKIHAGALLLPALAAIFLHLGGYVQITLPQWLLAATYALVGWSIGLGFTRETLRHAMRALVPILISIFALIAICAGVSYLLVLATGVDALTAYLAMSPGGMDSVAIIAASSHVDVAFVMAMQTVRLVLVIAIGPRLARFVASRVSRAPRAEEAAQ